MRPIALQRAPLRAGENPAAATGGLLASIRRDDGRTATVVVDTAFDVSTLSRGPCPSGPMASDRGSLYRSSLALLDATPGSSAVRAIVRNIDLFDICSGPAGDPSVQPAGALGGTLLGQFSVAFEVPRDPGRPASMTFYDRDPAPGDFLAVAGYAVLKFRGRGGADIIADNGSGNSVRISSTRAILRACVAPRPRGDALELCSVGDAAKKATGVDLSLALATGDGPLVLGEHAWARVAQVLGVPAGAGETHPLSTPHAVVPVAARWVTVPRMALVDREGDKDPGACAQLARGRRIEWVEAHSGQGACFQPCDVSGNLAVSSAAYVELAGTIPVAVVADMTPFLQGLNADYTSGQPSVDGVMGAGALSGTRFEVDYRNSPDQRVILSCLDDTPADACRTAPRCQRLSTDNQVHGCFGLPPTRRSPVCP